MRAAGLELDIPSGPLSFSDIILRIFAYLSSMGSVIVRARLVTFVLFISVMGEVGRNFARPSVVYCMG